jgi:hypothetical protein
VEDATWKPRDDIGVTTTATKGLMSIVWYSTKSTIVALAIHGLVRKSVGGTGRPVVRDHLHHGEIESAREIGTVTGTRIVTGIGGIVTDGNGIVTVNGTVTTVVVEMMSDGIVDSCAMCSSLHSMLTLHPASILRSLEPFHALARF